MRICNAKILLLFAIVLLPFGGSAHMDFVYDVTKGKVHLQCLADWPDSETGNKVEIFTEIADSLLRTKFLYAAPLYLLFDHDYIKRDTSYYLLGYGKFTVHVYGKRSTFEGIQIVVRDRDFDIKKLLLLVNAAYSNTDFIKRNQSKFKGQWRNSEWDSLNTISTGTIQRYLITPDSTIDKLLCAKWYRTLDSKWEDTAINYFFQNNTFHLYDPQAIKEKRLNGTQKKLSNTPYGKTILKVDDIFEVFGNAYDGHFVFANDSVFYFILPAKDTFQGPFTMHNAEAGRRPIMGYKHDNSSTNKFFLYIDERDDDTKVLFLPDSNLVISNYGVLEDSLINSIIQRRNGVEAPSEPSGPTPVMPVLLGICVLIIIGLARRQKAEKP